MSKTEEFYEFLTEDDETRACESIPDSECTQVPKNFSLNILNGSLTKLAEKLISPGLTLPWILSYLGAPLFLIGMLVPIKNVGSLLPQLLVSGKLRKEKKRKPYWVGAGLTQGICLLFSAILLAFIDNQSFVSYAIVVLLLLFSVASGVGSVSFKDVTGKTVPKGERGQMLSYRSTFGGALALIAGGALVFFFKEEDNKWMYTGLFAGAALLWIAAALIFSRIVEEPGSTKGGRTPIQELKSGASLLKTDHSYRNFIITRALLMTIPLLDPFFILVAKDVSQENWNYLGFIIIIGSLAQIVSSPFWGKLADQSSLYLMRISAGLSILSILYALVFVYSDSDFLNFYYFMPVIFINGIAYAGARLSRKTYIIDYAPDDERPTYVSVANTLIGLFTIVAASFGLIAEYFGLAYQFWFFLLLLVACISLSFTLKKV
ncbi:MFS transporter [Psychroflexus sediminis]|uniref:Predicted arabinose efflux permease, MFS family n=1 Tax=Psychroflexus sediminis TaxID=470826 RepID=A0A1G7WTA9_9FLAO|nr:MFS transporter [Psychroflexus sediminis]SDG74520.1 Predicted arabinose efflux permease, MFS family [Psychroflexus sediminis]